MNPTRNLLMACLLCMTGPGFSQAQRSIENPVPTRQVHLDFHTSEHIPHIGKHFSKEQFQEALLLGNVNQINIFSKGHHGYSYYPTELGTVHPHLDFDLLGAQMEACHEIGVVCPFYFTIGWSVLDAEKHPEWLIRHADGSKAAINLDQEAAPGDPRPHYSWYCLDPTIGGGYHEQILQQVKEICQGYPDLDGFWFDIYHIIPHSYSPYSLERMKAEGVDLDNPRAVEQSYARAMKAHMKALRELVAETHPEATVFFNSATHISERSLFTERLFDMNTQAEMEDLPTSWGGYDKLPLEAKYHLQQGTPAVAMSGKFHKAWGEFGGFKHSDAIKYEAAAMISFGASCNFGDQLHPSGEMDLETYRNIGKAYEYVKQIEAYGPGGKPVSRLGLWLTLNHTADQGMVNMLLESHHDFIVAELDKLDQLELLIIPSHASLDQEEAEAIQAWIADGGKLIALGEGILSNGGSSKGTPDAEKPLFLIDPGCSYQGPSSYHFDFTVIDGEHSKSEPLLSREIVSTPFLNYEAGLLANVQDGEVLARIREPYFNRTYSHYSSHRETPYKLEDSNYPALIRKGNVIWFSHHLDRLYYDHGVRLHRQLLDNAIHMLEEKPMLTVENLPSCGRVSLLHQEHLNRYVAHLLYSPALLRGDKIQVIEDFLPVPGVELKLQLDAKVKKVYQVPGEQELDFRREGNSIHVKVPTFTMHTGIVLEY